MKLCSHEFNRCQIIMARYCAWVMHIWLQVLTSRGNKPGMSLSKSLGLPYHNQRNLNYNNWPFLNLFSLRNSITIFLSNWSNWTSFGRSSKQRFASIVKLGGQWPRHFISPNDFAVVHWERFLTFQKQGEYSKSDNLRPALIHPWFNCMALRYKYFSVDLLEKDRNFQPDEKQKLLLFEQFGKGTYLPRCSIVGQLALFFSSRRHPSKAMIG